MVSIAYVDPSTLVAIAFEEPGASQAGERLEFDAEVFSRIEWILPDRPLAIELARALEAGYLRGADLWHIATALYVAPRAKEIGFITLDVRNGKSLQHSGSRSEPAGRLWIPARATANRRRSARSAAVPLPAPRRAAPACAAPVASQGIGGAWRAMQGFGTDMHLPAKLAHAVDLTRNNGDGTFSDRARTANDTGFVRGAAYGDFDGDGCLDLYLVNIGELEGRPGVAWLFRKNFAGGNHWLIMRTVGTRSNLSTKPGQLQVV